MEHDDVVDAIDEFRPEVLLHDLHHGGLHLVVVRLARELLDDVRAQIRGHDDHGVAEIDRAALAVGQATVVEDLQQHVEHVRVRLLDLIEQQHRIRPATHGFRQVAAFLVADVARRRADETRDRVLLHELGHVDADHRLFGIEEELGQRLATARSCRRRSDPETGTSRSAGSDRRVRRASDGSHPTPRVRLRAARPRACRSPPPCAAACPSRLRASSRSECRSTSRRLRRPPRPSPCCAAVSFPAARPASPARGAAPAPESCRTRARTCAADPARGAPFRARGVRARAPP